MRKTFLVIAALVLLAGCAGPASQEVGGEGSWPSDEAARRQAAEPRPSTDRARVRTPRDQRRGKAQGRSAAAARARAGGTGRMHRVLRVVDGDTVEVAYRGSAVSVRVIGIDTPETVHPSEPVECGGPQASAMATRLLTGKQVRLVFDPSQGRTDYYGRTLAYLEAPGVGDFGLAMIRAGRAAEYTYDTAYARQSSYLAAQRHAQAHHRGVWDRCGGVDTPLRSGPAAAQAQPTRPTGSDASGACDPNYDPCVPPYPPDLDCSDVNGPIRVLGDDPDGFDADGDGIGCDS
jgi:micrococcal nuclease